MFRQKHGGGRFAKKHAETSQAKTIFCRNVSYDMWGIFSVCTLGFTVAKTSSHYDRFAISVPRHISEARFMLCIIPTLMVLSFFFNSRILQTGILSWFCFWFSTTGPNQFVENQKQNQDNTGRFGTKNLPQRLRRNVLFPKTISPFVNDSLSPFFPLLMWEHIRCMHARSPSPSQGLAPTTMNSGRFGKRRFGKNMAADVSAKNMPKHLRLKSFAVTFRMI